MNVLITAGGTTERIDSVRSISNISTGKLGSLIADCFSADNAVEKIFYICSKTAIKPESNKVEFLCIDSVSDLEAAVREVLSNTSIDIIIHSMAVSDYKVKSVTTLASLLEKSKSAVSREGKINSDVDDMVLLMERTPKIISLFQTLSQSATLVGFKLLDNAALTTLIDKGYELLIKNKCSFVLANDLKDITDEKHTGYLIDKEKNFTKYINKPDIAAAIVTAALNERKFAI